MAAIGKVMAVFTDRARRSNGSAAEQIAEEAWTVVPPVTARMMASRERKRREPYAGSPM